MDKAGCISHILNESRMAHKRRAYNVNAAVLVFQRNNLDAFTDES